MIHNLSEIVRCESLIVKHELENKTIFEVFSSLNPKVTAKVFLNVRNLRLYIYIYITLNKYFVMNLGHFFVFSKYLGVAVYRRPPLQPVPVFACTFFCPLHTNNGNIYNLNLVIL